MRCSFENKGSLSKVNSSLFNCQEKVCQVPNSEQPQFAYQSSFQAHVGFHGKCHCSSWHLRQSHMCAPPTQHCPFGVPRKCFVGTSHAVTLNNTKLVLVSPDLLQWIRAASSGSSQLKPRVSEKSLATREAGVAASLLRHQQSHQRWLCNIGTNGRRVHRANSVLG